MNTLFPGRPNYFGPKKGWFALLHHDRLFEHSYDITERVEYVQKHKPEHEVLVRLLNMLYLGDCPAAGKRDALDADYVVKRDVLSAGYTAKCKSLNAAYTAKCAPLDAAYRAERDIFYAAYKAKCNALLTAYDAKCAALDAEVLVYVKTWIPDCPWNGKTLVFPTQA